MKVLPKSLNCSATSEHQPSPTTAPPTTPTTPPRTTSAPTSAASKPALSVALRPRMPRLLFTLHLVRHGETTANRDGIIQGHRDFDLTPTGESQATATAVRLRRNIYWQAHSSDLTRASRTAEIILEEHQEVTLSRTSLLREFALGAQEGLPRGTTWSKARGIKAREAGVSTEDFKESLRESPADVQKRARLFLNTLVADAARAAAGTAAATEGGEGGTDGVDAAAAADTAAAAAAAQDENARLVLVVSHGGFLNVMMLAVMGLGENSPIMSNCAVAVVDVFAEDEAGAGVFYVPRVLNDLSHFGKFELPASCHVENFDRQIAK